MRASGPGPPAGRREEGVILILTLLVVVLLAGALALAAGFVAERQRIVARETEEIQLVALADAALAETLAHIARSQAYGGLPERSFGPGTIESRVQVTGRNQRLVEARASYRGRERHIQAQVQLTAGGPLVTDWQVAPPRREVAGGFER